MMAEGCEGTAQACNDVDSLAQQNSKTLCMQAVGCSSLVPDTAINI